MTLMFIPTKVKKNYNVRKRKESQSSIELMSTLVGLFIIFLKIATFFGVFIYGSYVLSLKLLGEETDNIKIWSCTLLFTYLIFCIIYFFKGMVIGLRTRSSNLWVMPWLTCVLICCVVPALIVQSLVIGMFHLTERQNIWSLGISWGAFLISLVYIYGIYQFKTPTAPRILKWIYALGIKVSS